jgi:murein tripeptide amidase MpaA
LKISNANPKFQPEKKRKRKKKIEAEEEPEPVDDPNKPKEFVEKPVIVIIGRQHCGETHSSFIIHGLLNFLISRNIVAHKLREVFEWWIMPVVNPDGIVAGNYRTNL